MLSKYPGTECISKCSPEFPGEKSKYERIYIGILSTMQYYYYKIFILIFPPNTFYISCSLDSGVQKDS